MRWRKHSPARGRLAFQALLEQARLPTWRLWARDAAIEKKDALKARGIPGAQESSGDRNAGIATFWRPRRQQRCRGSAKM